MEKSVSIQQLYATDGCILSIASRDGFSKERLEALLNKEREEMGICPHGYGLPATLEEALKKPSKEVDKS